MVFVVQDQSRLKMFSKLLALACVLGAGAPALAQTCNGDGGYSCPAQDSVIPIQDGYNPADVNWNAVVADVLAMTDAEPRLCTMAIRAWFHDGAAHQGELRGQPVDDLFPGIGGSDGSIITHDVETEQEQNASHGFARIVRHVLVQLAAAHGTSHADALTIFAAMCPMRLQSQVDLPGHCTAQGFPLYVRPPPLMSPYSLRTCMLLALRCFVSLRSRVSVLVALVLRSTGVDTGCNDRTEG